MTKIEMLAKEGKRRIDADNWKYPKRKPAKYQRKNNKEKI
jgi:hypothetical protein